MSKILTVTVPAYNVEKYLDKCLSSMIIEQGMEDIEVLIVDDGSTDTTAEIAHDYEKRFPNSYRVISKENGGHGSCINTGIREATGKYFKVVDGDDWINTSKLEKYVAVLRESDADIVAADYECIQSETGKEMAYKPCTNNPDYYNKKVTIEQMATESCQVIKMHAITFKTKILKGMDRPIDEKCYYVDSEYITYPMVCADTVYYYHEVIYKYRLGRLGQSMDITSMQKKHGQHRRVLQSLLDFYRELPRELPNGKRYYIERCIAQMVENEFQIFLSLGSKKGIKQELREFDEGIKNKYPGIYHATKKKSITVLRWSNYELFGVGAYVYRKVKG